MSLSPIAQTLRELAAAQPEFATRLLTEPDKQADWYAVASLAADTTHLKQILARAARHYPSRSARPPAALWFGDYVFALEAVVAACYLTAQRIPDLSLDALWVRVGANGEVAGLAWRSPKFAALRGDADATHPDCFALDSRDALRDFLRAQLIAHLSPLIHALSMCAPFGKPGMWALAADYCAHAFAWVGGLMGMEQVGVAEARLLAAPDSPLHRKRDFILIEQSGLRYPLVDRASCCLYYCVEGGEYCSSCPRRPREERVELIRSWLEKRAAE